MSSSSVPSDNWSALIVAYQQRLGRCAHAPVASEGEYREIVTNLCEQHRDHESQRHFSAIRRQHALALELARAVDQASQLQAPALTALVWGVSTTAIRAALEASLSLVTLTRETKKLNILVPAFNREDLKKYPHNSQVQKPLQQLFGAYMDAYFSIFSESAPPVLCLDHFDGELEGKAELFRAQRQEWEQVFTEARDEEQRRITLDDSFVHGETSEAMILQSTKTQMEIVRELGRGEYGIVYLVKQNNSGELFALKSIRAPKERRQREESKKRVLNEVKIMRKLRHWHIASLNFYTEEPAGFNLVMEPVADYNLRVFLQTCCIAREYPKDQIIRLDNWFGCLIIALGHAHSEKVKHNDLKLSNILIKDDRVYLADFGCSRDYGPSQSSASNDYLVTGTLAYWPPEPESQRRRAADIFSLGCVFSEMLTVRQGRSLKEYEARRKVDERDNPWAFSKNLDAVKDWLQALPGIEADIPQLLLKVTLNMLQHDPEERKDAKAIKRWLKQEGEALFCDSCL